jgi:O-antigen ligase
MLTGFGITLLAADGIPSLPRLHTLLDRLVAAGAVLALLGVAQFLTGFDITSWLHIPGLISTTELTFIRERLTFRRVAGTASHPIEFGVALAVLLPLALHRAMSVPRLWRWVTVAVMAVALPMSLSRSAVLTLGVTALVIVPAWSWRRRLVVLASLPVFAAGMHFLAPGLLTALESLFTNIESDSSTHGRTEDYAVVGRFIQASPLLGRGLGTFNPAKYVLLDNQYLGALVEIGAVGLTALLLLFLIGAGTATSARRRAGDDAATAELAQCLAGAILGLAVSFATFDGLAFPTVTGLLFLLCGCAGALWRLTGTGPAGPSARQFRNAPAPAHSSRR